ncbi:response regulator transcription factor [Desulfothermobacter acidiphilus]|uniref:response regulator transcription factor n=1 Tax=Desulfothermobacter acidiphilus TaxID=1938353 RepID=UPI003F8867C4
MCRLLLVEDDQALARLLEGVLSRYGYQVRVAEGEELASLEEVVKRFRPHLLLLDVNLPFYDGFYWVRRLRCFTNIPILFISGRGDPLDQIRGLEQGGDDYLVKPFTPELLVAKVGALLRRAHGELAVGEKDLRVYGGLTLDMRRQELSYGEVRLWLTPTETRLMARLLEAQGEVVSREELFLAAWDDNQFVDDNTLTVNVGRLRKKLERLGLPRALVTVRGSGYRLALVPGGEKDSD